MATCVPPTSRLGYKLPPFTCWPTHCFTTTRIGAGCLTCRSVFGSCLCCVATSQTNVPRYARSPCRFGCPTVPLSNVFVWTNFFYQHAVRALGSAAALDEVAVLVNSLKGIPTIVALCKSDNNEVCFQWLPSILCIVVCKTCCAALEHCICNVIAIGNRVLSCACGRGRGRGRVVKTIRSLGRCAGMPSHVWVTWRSTRTTKQSFVR